MTKKILLPTDGSEQAERAGEYAISLADISGAEIIVLNVIDVHYLDSLPQEDLRLSLENELREEGKKALKRFQTNLEDKECDGACKNIIFRPIIKKGNPSDVILKIIDEEGIDQVVMGKSGKHGLERIILGRTTDRVVRKASIPVNVIA